MKTQNEKMLSAVEDQLGQKANRTDELLELATKEERESTPEEREEMAKLLKDIKELKAKRVDIQQSIELEQDIKETSRKFGGRSEPQVVSSDARVKPNGEPIDRLVKSVGEQFTESDAFKKVHEEFKSGHRSMFSTGAVPLQSKGTLLEGAGGGGDVFVEIPQTLPGVVEKQFQPLTVADLILSGQTNATSIRYLVEGTATSGAAGVAEGGEKPESTLGLTDATDPVKKIATVIHVSDEMLEDVAAVQSYINGRLSLFVRIEEERQLVRGAGTNELIGVMDSTRGINIYAGGTAAGTKSEQLFKALNGQRGSALIEPDWIALHPADYQQIRLSKDGNEQFYGGGPFLPPYGGQGWAGIGQSQLSQAQDSLWQKPVVLTTATGSGTALIGTRSAAQVFRRGGLSVEATNSHSDHFTHNLVAIRCEERLALAVYRPSAFTEVRLGGSE